MNLRGKTTNPIDNSVMFERRRGDEYENGSLKLANAVFAVMKKIFNGFKPIMICEHRVAIARPQTDGTVEKIDFIGLPRDIVVIVAVIKECGALWGYKKIFAMEMTESMIDALLAETKIALVSLNSDHAAPFDLPANQVQLARTAMMLATGVTDPGRIEKMLMHVSPNIFCQSIELSIKSDRPGATVGLINEVIDKH